MQTIMNLLRSNSTRAKDWGLLAIRLGLGLIFVKHGFSKLTGGIQTWQFLGSQMKHFGITFAPAMWGFAAACAEFFGGISLLLGYLVRVSSLFLIFMMFVALTMHIKQGDSWARVSHPAELMAVFVGLLLAGAGTYSLDYYISRKQIHLEQ